MSVHEQATRKVASGQRYEVAAGELHASSVALTAFAATLVATRPSGRAWPWVVGHVDAPAVVEVERTVADPARVQALLQRVVAATAGLTDGR